MLPPATNLPAHGRIDRSINGAGDDDCGDDGCGDEADEADEADDAADSDDASGALDDVDDDDDYDNDDKVNDFINKVGLPIIVKAASGGGGKGMRIVNKKSELKKSIEAAKVEAKKVNFLKVILRNQINNTAFVGCVIITYSYNFLPKTVAWGW